MRNTTIQLCGIAVAIAACCSAEAQPRIQFPTSGAPAGAVGQPVGVAPTAPPLTTSPFAQVAPLTPTTPVTPVQPFTASPPTTLPPATTMPGAAGLMPVQPPTGATLQPPAFDPFSSTAPGAATAAPSLSTGPALAAPPQTILPMQPAPGVIAPAQAQPFAAQPYPGYPGQPGVQFPGGLPQAATPLPGPYLRLFAHPRFRYTWIEGSKGAEMDINDVEAAVTANWPNFLWSTEPLRISPGFIFHFWQGPSGIFSPEFNMPSRAYSAYLSFDWTSNQQRRFGADLNFVIGYFSDFKKYDDTAIRLMGTGLGWYRLTETMTFKGGVTYLDRVDIKLLPAFGLFWYPNEDVRFDIYFPRPKLAQRLNTFGNTDLWWYIGAEYGGGSWTIRRPDWPMAPGAIDQVDINDIRLFAGLEWLSGYVGITGFVEAGWVTERKLVFRRIDPMELELKDSFMVRAGLAF